MCFTTHKKVRKSSASCTSRLFFLNIFLCSSCVFNFTTSTLRQVCFFFYCNKDLVEWSHFSVWLTGAGREVRSGSGCSRPWQQWWKVRLHKAVPTYSRARPEIVLRGGNSRAFTLWNKRNLLFRKQNKFYFGALTHNVDLNKTGETLSHCVHTVYVVFFFFSDSKRLYWAVIATKSHTVSAILDKTHCLSPNKT